MTSTLIRVVECLQWRKTFQGMTFVRCKMFFSYKSKSFRRLMHHSSPNQDESRFFNIFRLLRYPEPRKSEPPHKGCCFKERKQCFVQEIHECWRTSCHFPRFVQAPIPDKTFTGQKEALHGVSQHPVVWSATPKIAMISLCPTWYLYNTYRQCKVPFSSIFFVSTLTWH